jgi:tetratricopeptide (TPR) repeat protein
MNKIAIVLIIATFLYHDMYACINGETLILKNNVILYQDEESHVPYGHQFADKQVLKKVMRELDSLYRTTKDVDYLSDKGVLLILFEKYSEAIELYLSIEKLQPDRYSTASNLGTAYELTGQNMQALKWIKRAVEIEPKSHKNSEWLHIKILEAKIKGEQFYTTCFLLNTDFGTALLPQTTLSDVELEELFEEVYYQLNERVSFIKPKDRIVAQLLFDLGNITFLQRDYSNARANYQLAKDYGFSDPIVEKRIKESKKLARQPKASISAGLGLTKETKTTYLIYIIMGVIILGTGMALFYKWKMNNY